MKKIKLYKEDMHKGYLILINRYHLLKNNDIQLSTFNEHKVEFETLNKLKELFKLLKIKDEIILVSAYRTYDDQVKIYKDSLNDNGEEYTTKFVALPNASEHQSGLAIDLALNQDNIDFICPSFPYYGICQKFRDNMSDYGFIERYNLEKSDITKISKEEWHFRYITYPHSSIIKDKDMCLEEYIEYLKEFNVDNKLVYKDYEIYYVKYETDLEIEVDDNYQISGNNVDGFIITIRQ